jgi:UDP-N-acetylmuramoyl-L-alanyl-D-glutamate--2,6-diaminopimelate ligase
MGLRRLGDLVGTEVARGLSEAERARLIAGVTADSREVRPDYLFAALQGTKADGASFVPDALKRGAAAVLGRPEMGRGKAGDAVVLLDRNPRRRFAELAARFYQKQPRVIAAVTGTNGKTSVASFLRQIWEALGSSAASLGTLGVVADSVKLDFGLTTPDPVQLHMALAALKEAGIEHVAMEASSHGLAQYRLDGVRLAAAAVTNLTRDHLDYHASFEDYAYAKLRLFGEVMAPGGVAVINADATIGIEAEALSWARGHRVLSVGVKGRDLTLERAAPSGTGQALAVCHEGTRYDIAFPLAGSFQASNALIAAGLAIGTGSPGAAVFAAIERLACVPGRLELVASLPGGAAAYVDYAHTPDALQTMLTALRPHAAGRLHLVFGCGGDRDQGKRPQMGRIAAQLADRVIVTDDNPRTEDAGAVRAAILAEAPGAAEIPDRAQAIEQAISALQPGDVLIVAGKGHETGQIVGETVKPFSDRAEILRIAGGEA